MVIGICVSWAMRFKRLGEGCLILQGLDSPTHAAELFESVEGVLECVPAFDQLAIFFDPDSNALGLLEPVLEGSAGQPALLLQNGGEQPEGLPPASSHVLPASYDGPDLEECANALNITPHQLVELHASATFTVEAIGFCPGFPYLSGLPANLSGLPRRPTPRPQVGPGSIAIVGNQSCIYPLPRPGGWNLIARTPLVLVDPEEGFFPISVGDTLRFEPVDIHEFNRLEGERL